VLLGRLRIRAKLALLVMIPLLAVGALTVPVVLERVGLAGRAGDAAVSVRVASQVGSLAQDLQRERLLAAGFLVGAVDRSRLVLQMSAVSDRITDVRFDLGDDLPAEVSDAIDAVKSLADLRVAVLDGSGSTARVTTAYSTVINRLIGSLRLVDGIDAATDEGRQVIALDALLRADEPPSRRRRSPHSSAPSRRYSPARSRGSRRWRPSRRSRCTNWWPTRSPSGWVPGS